MSRLQINVLVTVLVVVAFIFSVVYLIREEPLEPVAGKLGLNGDIFLPLSTHNVYKGERVEHENVSRGGGRVITMMATAYTHTGYNTASGVYPTSNNSIAGDPAILPLGTMVLIDGCGPYRVEDTGCRNGVVAPDGYYQHIQGNRIDIFMETKAECIEFGRKEVRVTILRE